VVEGYLYKQKTNSFIAMFTTSFCKRWFTLDLNKFVFKYKEKHESKTLKYCISLDVSHLFSLGNKKSNRMSRDRSNTRERTVWFLCTDIE